MEVTKFIETACTRYRDRDNKNKALVLIQSINVEIEANRTFNVQAALNDTVAMVDMMNQSEYLHELKVVRNLLEFYIENENFDVVTIPIPYAKENSVRYNIIKEHLQRQFAK